jgi:DNA-binding response OmpR family regulator
LELLTHYESENFWMGQGNTHRKKILVAEDELLISQICVRILTAEGFDVDVAINGLIAKDMASRNGYDLCLVDIKIPVMSGTEFYQYLEEEHPGLARRVIFTTGDVMSNNIEAFFKEVNRPYLPKPFTPDELKSAIREVLP